MASDAPMTRIEERLMEMVNDEVFGGLTKVVKDAGIRVFSVYRWASKRNFSDVFDAQEYAKDRVYASEELVEMFGSLGLDEIVDRLIEEQTKVIWNRRVSEGKNGGPRPSDRQEAKRYIAFLFFDDLVKLCSENRSCPRVVLAESKWNSLIINLLKSLSIEDYCKIKAYLMSIEAAHSGQGGFHHQQSNFLNAMGALDSRLVNCGLSETHAMAGVYEHFLDGYGQIRQAKMNRADSLGFIPSATVSRFMETYYGFLETFARGNPDSEHAPAALRELYRAGNTRIVNAAEYLLKCGISSLVPKETHSAIRQECFKPALSCL